LETDRKAALNIITSSKRRERDKERKKEEEKTETDR